MKEKLLLLLLVLSSYLSYTQKINNKEIIHSIEILQNTMYYSNLVNQDYIIVNNDTAAIILEFEDGTAVLSYRKDLPVLKFFTDKGEKIQNKNLKILKQILTYDYRLQLNKNQFSNHNREIWGQWLKAKWDFKNLLTDTIGPLLESKFGQVNCKDANNHYIYVTNYYTPHNYAVGCVALTFVSVLHYYQWPLKGQGNHSYTDSYGSSTGTYKADFSNTNYRWDLVQNEYYGVESSVESRQALGLAAYHCAISVDMDFESDGSTSNINRIPYAASHYFRYDSPVYKSSEANNFWKLLDSSLIDKNPVQLAVYTDNGSGHAIVCDGMIPTSTPSDKYYHLNMGWWGNSNGWYLIQSDFNAGGYTIVDAAVFQMLPVPQLNEVEYDIETNTATISWNYSSRIKNPVFILQQKIDNRDWEVLSDSITDFQYSFLPDIKREYQFRIKTKKNNLWSEEISFNPSEKSSKFEEISVNPTLVRDRIKIRYKNLKNSQVLIYATDGHLVYSENLSNYNGMEKVIDLSWLRPQIYFVKVIAEGKIKSVKIAYQGRVQ